MALDSKTKLDLKNWISNLYQASDRVESEDETDGYLDSMRSIIASHKNYSASITELQSDLNKLHAEKKAILQAQEQLSILEEKQAAIEKQIKDMPSETEKDIMTVKLRDLFTKATGLSFKVNDNGNAVAMIFKYVDPNQPDREFKVILDVIEPNNEWKLIDDDPPVEGVVSLIKDLNTTNDFSKFARTLRTLFKNSL